MARFVNVLIVVGLALAALYAADQGNAAFFVGTWVLAVAYAGMTVFGYHDDDYRTWSHTWSEPREPYRGRE